MITKPFQQICLNLSGTHGRVALIYVTQARLSAKSFYYFIILLLFLLFYPSDAVWVGPVNCVRDVSRIPVVNTAPAVSSRGSATATKDGAVYSAIKVGKNCAFRICLDDFGTAGRSSTSFL